MNKISDSNIINSYNENIQKVNQSRISPNQQHLYLLFKNGELATTKDKTLASPISEIIQKIHDFSPKARMANTQEEKNEFINLKKNFNELLNLSKPRGFFQKIGFLFYSIFHKKEIKIEKELIHETLTNIDRRVQDIDKVITNQFDKFKGQNKIDYQEFMEAYKTELGKILNPPIGINETNFNHVINVSKELLDEFLEKAKMGYYKDNIPEFVTRLQNQLVVSSTTEKWEIPEDLFTKLDELRKNDSFTPALRTLIVQER